MVHVEARLVPAPPAFHLQGPVPPVLGEVVPGVFRVGGDDRMIDHAAGRGDRRGAVRVQDVAYACQRSRRIVRCGCRDSLVAIYSADELMSLRYRLFAKSIGKAINDLKSKAS